MAGTSMFIMWKFLHTHEVYIKRNGNIGMGNLWLKWMGQLWQNELLVWGDVLKKTPTNTGLQGSTLSDHCITTGFKNTGLQGSTLSDRHMTTGREGEGGGGGGTSSMLLHWCYHQH